MTDAVSIGAQDVYFGLPDGTYRHLDQSTITIEPVFAPTNRGVDAMLAVRIVVHANAPDGILNTATTLSFDMSVIAETTERYRCFYQHVEWKKIDSQWSWTGDRVWDEFAAEKIAEEEWHPEFLGIARLVDGPFSDKNMQAMVPPDQHYEKVIGGFYVL